MKAIIPAAGLGTRLLPVTKSVPKELLPVEGKPAIQWVLEEGARAGLREFIIVISPRKAALRDYLTPLEGGSLLMGYAELFELEQLLRSVNITFVEQPKPLGLGDAVLRCRDAVGGSPFALLLPDNVFVGRSLLLEQLLEIHRASQKSCAALWRATGANLGDGAVMGELESGSVYSVRRILAKGETAVEATDLRPIGRGVYEPYAFGHLERAATGDSLDDVPMLDGLARDGSLLGLLTAERFHHIGAGTDGLRTMSAP